jgi:hypothetical protein
MNEELNFKSPINGAATAPPVSHPAANAWPGENRTMKLGDHQILKLNSEPESVTLTHRFVF